MKENQKIPLPGFSWKGEFTTKDKIDQYFSNPNGIQWLLCGRCFQNLTSL
jgi:hypothetical protein